METNQTKPYSARQSLKRKLEPEFQGHLEQSDRPLKIPSLHQYSDEEEEEERDLLAEIRSHLRSLESAAPEDRAAAKRASHALCEVAKNEDNVDSIVDCGAIPVLVERLKPPMPQITDGAEAIKYEFEVEKACALALGLISDKSEYQQRIVDAGALPHLVDLLKIRDNGVSSRAVSGVLRRAADAISNLVHENCAIKRRVGIEGGIPPLVELLDYPDAKVQRASAAAIRTLAFKMDENKKQILACNALPTLVLMLMSDDAAIHYEAVGVIGNLVHSSPDIKKKVILAGALQPVIGLLSSCCTESQREAALLLGQFAAADSDCKIHIVQRGAVKPLLVMLQSSDSQLKEMAAFAIGRLTQDTHNQAGIVYGGGMGPLLKLVDSKNALLQHNAAFALYGLADNEDNVAEFVKLGGIQKLQDAEFNAQPTKECIAKTLKRLEEKIHGRVLNHLLYLMRGPDITIRKRVALSLAHVCAPGDRKTIFVYNNGLDLLIELLESGGIKHKRYASLALFNLATRDTSISPTDAAPPSPTSQVYLGEQYVNNAMLSDVTFLIEGKQFYAHRICLLASSDAFRAMFDGGYRERTAKDVEIPNIRWDVFELMMRYIYSGSVHIERDIAQDLLRAADQYLVEGLKRLCEYTIAQDITVENVSPMYELSIAFNATSLRQACIVFILEQFDQLSTRSWYPSLIKQIVPEIRRSLTTIFKTSPA